MTHYELSDLSTNREVLIAKEYDAIFQYYPDLDDLEKIAGYSLDELVDMQENYDVEDFDNCEFSVGLIDAAINSYR